MVSSALISQRYFDIKFARENREGASTFARIVAIRCRKLARKPRLISQLLATSTGSPQNPRAVHYHHISGRGLYWSLRVEGRQVKGRQCDMRLNTPADSAGVSIQATLHQRIMVLRDHAPAEHSTDPGHPGRLRDRAMRQSVRIETEDRLILRRMRALIYYRGCAAIEALHFCGAS